MENKNKFFDRALTVVARAESAKEAHEEDLLAIQEMLLDTFEIMAPRGNRKLPSYLLFQALKSVSEKITMPSFELHADGASREIKRLVTLGVEYALERGRFIDALESGFGAFEKMFAFGDAFIHAGANAESGFPVLYRSTSLSQLYIDPEAESMRGSGSGRDADEIVAVYQYSPSEAQKLYPFAELVEGRMTSEGENEQVVEVLHYYNKAEKVYAVFGGKEGTLLQFLEGEDYPFVLDWEAYIPLVHLKCFPMPNGFYSKGIGHLVYRLGIIGEVLMNKGIEQGLQNSNPIRMLSVAQGKKSSFLARLKEAYEQQKRGLTPVILNEVGAGESVVGKMETLSTDELTREWERIFNQLDNTLARCGINLDRVNNGDKPLGVVEIEEERMNEFIADIVSQNSSELKFAVELAIDFLRKFVTPLSPYYDLPLRVKESFEAGEGRFVPRITLGMVADELRRRSYGVEINSRSGAVNSRTMSRLRRERTLKRVPQGSLAYKRLVIEDAQDDGIELDESELA